MRPGGANSLIGTVLSGRYRIERVIGEGGMGAVYQAEHAHMRKRLAVKVLHPEMSRLSEVVTRFEREAMAAAHIDHPNVAAATDFGKLEDGSFFLVLEYVEGQSLREALSGGRLALARAIRITRQIASALARAHGLGIVHRDLKPENVMLVEREGDRDFVKVLDFGIAKVPVGELAGEKEKGPGQPVLTQLGMVYGTPEYMAPEQALGQPVDARADLYALGAMAFEMVTGRRPYDHASKVTLLGMHVTAPVPKMSERAPDAQVPAELDAIVSKLLAKESTQRFADARELIDALDAVSALLGIEAPPSIVLPPGGVPRSPSLAQLPTSLAQPSALGAIERGSNLPTPLLSVVTQSIKSMSPRLIAIAGGALGALIVLVVVVVLVAGGSHGVGSTSLDGAAAIGATSSSTPPPPQPDPKLDEVIATAEAKIEKGDYATAIDALTKVEPSHPDRAEVHRLLERAYTGIKNTKDAMHEAALWIASDPKAIEDLKLQEDVRNAALFKESTDVGFELLESKMGVPGADILYDIAYGTSGRMYPQAAARAKKSLDLDEVRNHASPALAVALEFRDGKTCDAKRALLERARDQGDARMLPLLQPFAATRGCGFLGRTDCNPCMHKDRLLWEAMSAIDERAKAAAAQPSH
jgi:serine/threonine-protein kinase